MPTALSYIETAMGGLGLLRAGETVSAEDATLGLLRLNLLLDAWENEGLFGYATTNTVFSLPAATTSRTIGASQQINMVRPLRLLSGSFSRLSGIDYPLEPVTEGEYNAISLKSSYDSTAPSVCFYDGGVPTGIVYFWPKPSAAVEVHLITPTAKTTAADTTTNLVHPPGYQRAIGKQLALEIASDFGVEPSVSLRRDAANAKRAIKRTNSRVPQLQLNYPNSRGGISLGDAKSGNF